MVLLPWKIQFAGGRFFESPLQVPLGFGFLLFFPAWFLVRRRSSTFAEKCAVGFSIAYLIYWWVSLPALRYAITPAFLLMASIAMRLTAWYESSAPLAKSCALTACCYALWFALCGAQIVEINGPQFRFFTRQTDSAQYLGEALATFPALLYLKKEAGPGSSVFGVMNCSAAYAPDPALFDCAYSAAEARNLEAKLRGFDFQYVILPAGKSAEPVFTSVFDRISGGPLFEDANFRVYRLHTTNQNAFTRKKVFVERPG
jgi:hypothetical protein